MSREAYSKELINFNINPKEVHTKNGKFEIQYQAGERYKIKFGYLFIKHKPDSVINSFKIDSYQNNLVWLTKNGPTQKEYEKISDDPLIEVKRTGKLNCETYLMQ
ncbi:MAG: hypothetical protein NUV46_03615 [Nanoarchaeota archaeon]|nr:hypothetical protein [Nanoarchaeota archaeon]